MLSLLRECIQKSLIDLPDDVVSALKSAYAHEKNEIARIHLDNILKNIEIAKKDRLPLCQDTGLPIFFVEYGKDRTYSLDEIILAINDAVRDIHLLHPIRPSLVDPLTRKPIGYSPSPAFVHIEYTSEDASYIHFLPKGAGSENASFVRMMSPTSTEDEIVNVIAENIRLSAGTPCPPIILGVGIGGTLDLAALCAKKSLLRRISDKKHPLEKKIIDTVNALGIGPMGDGGSITCLNVAVTTLPCHTASLPLAVNVQCWCARRKSLILKNGKVYEDT